MPHLVNCSASIIAGSTHPRHEIYADEICLEGYLPYAVGRGRRNLVSTHCHEPRTRKFKS